MTNVFDEATVIEQKAYEEYKKVEAENYHLKRQLANKNKEIKQLKHYARTLKIRVQKAEDRRKDKYINRKR